MPLILLAIPSALIGWFTVKPMLFGGFFAGAITVQPAHDVLGRIGEEFHGSGALVWAAFTGLPVCLAAAGVFAAWLFFLKKPALADGALRSFKWLHTILVDKYGFDWFNQNVLVAGARALGGGLWQFRRSGSDRRRSRQRQRARGRLALRCRALCAVRISLSLRVRDDPRPRVAAHVAGLAA